MGNSTLATLGIAINAQQGIRTLDTLNSKLGGLTNAANIAQMATAAVFSGGAIFAAKEMVRYASDVQETTSKFNVVFKNVSDAADAAFSNLSNNYNMSGQAARTMLSDTGDLLSGFGMAANVALDLSNRVNILATDLSSFTNYAGGASGASDALTKALLGEREQAKMLGLAIKETDVQAQMALDTKNGEIYASESAAKAYATYKIMLSQSKNAIGDTARSVNNYQYKLNTLTKVVGEAKAAIGGALIAPATKIIESINRVVGAFNRLPDTIKNTAAIGGTLLATLGGLAIGFAPVISAIANMAMARRMERAEAERGTASNTANAASFNESTTTTYENTVATNANTQAKQSNAAVGGTAAVDANTYSVLSNTDAENVNTYSTGANTNATILSADTTNANTVATNANTTGTVANTTSSDYNTVATEGNTLWTAKNTKIVDANSIATGVNAAAAMSNTTASNTSTAAIDLNNSKTDTSTVSHGMNTVALESNSVAIYSNASGTAFSTKLVDVNSMSVSANTEVKALNNVAVETGIGLTKLNVIATERYISVMGASNASIAVHNAGFLKKTTIYAADTYAMIRNAAALKIRSLSSLKDVKTTITATAASIRNTIALNLHTSATKLASAPRQLLNMLIAGTTTHIIANNKALGFNATSETMSASATTAGASALSLKTAAFSANATVVLGDTAALDANTGSLILNTSAEAENAAAVTTSNFTDAAKTGSLSLRTAALELNSEATNVNTISTNADANASSSFIVCKGAETEAIIANTEARVANAAAGAGMAFGAAGRAATSGGTSKASNVLFTIPGLNIVIGLLGKMGAAVLRFVPPLKWCISAVRVAGLGIGSIGNILIKAASCVAVFSASFIGTMKAIQAAPVLLENFKRYLSESFTWENVKSTTKHAIDAVGGMFLWVGKQINKTADSLGEFIKGLVGINTMTGQRVAAEYYQKTIDDYAEFRQSQIDADNAALDERKRIAESINIATNEHHKNTNRLFLTSEQKKAAERRDEIDVSGKKYNSLLAPALTRAKNNDEMERLEAERKKYVQRGNDAKAQMALDNEVLKSVGLSKAERALLEKRIKANEKIIKDSKENEEKIVKSKQLLEQNADPAAYAKAVSEIFLLLGKQVKLGEEAQAKWPELATQLEEVSKTGDSDKVAGVANALFTAIAEDAGVGSEISEAWHKAKENFTEEVAAADATAPMKGINNMLTLLSQNPEFKKFAPLFEKFKDEVIKTAGVAPDYLALANAALEDSSLRLVDAVEKAKQNAERDNELFDLGLKQEELTAYTPREHNEVVAKQLLNTRGRITQSQQANIDAPKIKKEIDDIESHIAQEIAKGENIDGKKIAELQEQLESKRNAYAQAQVLVKTPKELLELANDEIELQNKLRSGSTEIFRRDLEDIQSLMEDSFFEVNQALEAANTAFDKATKGSDNITPQNYKTAVDQYREQINTRANEERRLHQLELEKLQQRHKEIKDEDGYQEERRQIERDIAKKNQLLGYTNADGNKIAGTIETERISQVNALDEKQSEHSKNWNEKQKKLREDSIAMLDQLNLKEAKTSEERMAIYRRQWLDLEQAYASAPTDEERLSYVSKLTALSDTIKSEYAKRFDDNWKTAAPQKAIKAGTSDASAIQNRLFNNYQKIMAKNSDVSVTLNRAISTSLEKILENSSRDTILSFAGGNS